MKFDPNQKFESPSTAIAMIAGQPSPVDALLAVVRANVLAHDFRFASELVATFESVEQNRSELNPREESTQAPYAIGQKFRFIVGQTVICNGYAGAIGEVHAGQLNGMVTVKLSSGSVTVSASYPDCYPAPEDRSHLLQEWILRYSENALVFNCQAENISHAIEQCENAYPGELVLSAVVASVDNPIVKCWDAPYYNGEGPHTSAMFEMRTTDHRISNGQLFIDFNRKGSDSDQSMILNLEVHRLPDSPTDTQCLHLHFDEDTLALSIFKTGGSYVLRPENFVDIRPTVLASGEHAFELYSNSPPTRAPEAEPKPVTITPPVATAFKVRLANCEFWNDQHESGLTTELTFFNPDTAITAMDEFIKNAQAAGADYTTRDLEIVEFKGPDVVGQYSYQQLCAKAGMPVESTRVRLTLDVDYDLNGLSVSEMSERLRAAIERVIGEGHLTGETAATVDQYSMETEVVPLEAV